VCVVCLWRGDVYVVWVCGNQVGVVRKQDWRGEYVSIGGGEVRRRGFESRWHLSLSSRHGQNCVDIDTHHLGPKCSWGL